MGLNSDKTFKVFCINNINTLSVKTSAFCFGSWVAEFTLSSVTLRCPVRVLLNVGYAVSVAETWFRLGAWPFAWAAKCPLAQPIKWSFAWLPLTVDWPLLTSEPFISNSFSVATCDALLFSCLRRVAYSFITIYLQHSRPHTTQRAYKRLVNVYITFTISFRIGSECPFIERLVLVKTFS